MCAIPVWSLETKLQPFGGQGVENPSPQTGRPPLSSAAAGLLLPELLDLQGEGLPCRLQRGAGAGRPREAKPQQPRAHRASCPSWSLSPPRPAAAPAPRLPSFPAATWGSRMGTTHLSIPPPGRPCRGLAPGAPALRPRPRGPPCCPPQLVTPRVPGHSGSHLGLLPSYEFLDVHS